jgi:hypothetical protein
MMPGTFIDTPWPTSPTFGELPRLPHCALEAAVTRSPTRTPDCAKPARVGARMLEYFIQGSPPASSAKEMTMEVLHPRCAGLDVHKDSVVACVRLAEGGRVYSRRTLIGRQSVLASRQPT